MVVDLARRGLEVWGIDISPSMVEIARRKLADYPELAPRVHLDTGDIEALAHPDCTFDAVVAAGVVEYLADDRMWPAQLARVLKPGGLLVLNVTNRWAVRRWSHPVTEGLKSWRPARAAMGFVKERILRRGPLHLFPFRPRVHSPQAFDRFLAAAGFEKLAHRYFDFALFPAPVDTLLGVALTPWRRALERFAHRGLVLNGTGYIVLARRAGGPVDGG